MQQDILVPPLFPATYLLLWLLLLPSASNCLCKQTYHCSPWATAKAADITTINCLALHRNFWAVLALCLAMAFSFKSRFF